MEKPKPKITIPTKPVTSTVSVVATESESLHTPVLTSTPSLMPFTAGMVFTYPSSSLDTQASITSHATSHQGSFQQSQTAQPCGIAHRRSSSSGDQSDHSLHSPTILTLWSTTLSSWQNTTVRVDSVIVWRKITGKHDRNKGEDGNNHFKKELRASASLPFFRKYIFYVENKLVALSGYECYTLLELLKIYRLYIPKCKSYEILWPCWKRMLMKELHAIIYYCNIMKGIMFKLHVMTFYIMLCNKLYMHSLRINRVLTNKWYLFLYGS